MTTIAREISAIARLSTPVVVTQLATMMLGVVDNMMLGNLSIEALNASSLGRLWVLGTSLFGMGLVFGIDPFVSHAHGAGDGRGAAVALQRGIVVALLASLPIGALWFFTEEALLLFGEDPGLAREAELYALVQLPGLPFLLAFHALRQYLQGRGLVRPAMWVAILANGLNALGNWILIFGMFGAPALGVAGAGIATGVTQIAMFLGLLAFVRAGHLARGAWEPWSRESFDARGIQRVLQVGFPAAVQIGLEVWAFQIVTLWSGHLGPTELAANTIVLNLASVSFMVPLGIAIGTSTRVGNLIGAGDREGAQRAAWAAFLMGAAVMAVWALVFLAGRRFLPALYLTLDGPSAHAGTAAVLDLCARVLPIAAAFQLFDGLQVVGGGILRGMGRTVPGAVINLVGYYALALPLAGWLAFGGIYGFEAPWLAFGGEHGLEGLWWGLSAGLATIALSLVAWISVRGPRSVAERLRA